MIRPADHPIGRRTLVRADRRAHLPAGRPVHPIRRSRPVRGQLPEMLGKWWEVWQGRLEHELEALRAAGIKAQLDNAVFASGVVKIDFDYRAHDGAVYPMYAVFSDLYPYFRFEVYAETLSLTHHQNPIGKNLCLVGRETVNWHPSDTLADFIRDRMASVLTAGGEGNKDAVAALEAHQAEPYSAYYQYADNASLLVDTGWNLDNSVPFGELVIGLDGTAEQIDAPIRGAILSVLGPNGQTLAEAPAEWDRMFPNVIRGPWCRLAAPVPSSEPAEIQAAVRRVNFNITFRPERVRGLRCSVIGVLFPEELGWRDAISDGWIFIGGKSDRDHRLEPKVMRAGRAGRTDLRQRIPIVGDRLAECRIAIVGLGGLGAPAAVEFAKAGIRSMNFIDADVLDPGTIVRWPLGFAYAGLRKADALKAFIDSNYPYTEVHVWRRKLGAAPEPPASDVDIVRAAIDGVDLVLDATAEDGLQYFLSEVARSRGLPYIAVSTTFGAWGGRIARFLPGGRTGCWLCYQRQMETRAIPIPPADPNGFVQPAGCAAPTYTGLSYDATEVSMAGVRLAVSTLMQGHETYGVDWDVAVLSLRDSSGKVILPTWWTGNLSIDPECRGRH